MRRAGIDHDADQRPEGLLRRSRRLIVAYVLYMMIRRRKGERPGAASREPEL